MEFITKQDFLTHLYEGQIDAISDNDDDILNDAIATAMAQVAGYLNTYDTDLIFSGNAPIPSGEVGRGYADLRSYIKDIAKWHFIQICNVGQNLDLAESRYKSAIAELMKIQQGKLVPKWPKLTEQQNKPAFSISSRPKRGNYF